MQTVISTSPDVLGGTVVFVGTRVPFQTLLDYIEHGESINTFLQDFPSVSHSQVIAVLEEAKEKLISQQAVA